MGREDGPQPREELGLGPPAELVALVVGVQQRRLHHVRRIDLSLEEPAVAQPGERDQVAAVALDGAGLCPRRGIHRYPKLIAIDGIGPVRLSYDSAAPTASPVPSLLIPRPYIGADRCAG